jgi:hypothetical protein
MPLKMRHIGGVPSVEFSCEHSAQEARQILRSRLVGREPLLRTRAERHVVGFVQDPSFELVAVGPASEGSVGSPLASPVEVTHAARDHHRD